MFVTECNLILLSNTTQYHKNIKFYYWSGLFHLIILNPFPVGQRDARNPPRTFPVKMTLIKRCTFWACFKVAWAPLCLRILTGTSCIRMKCNPDLISKHYRVPFHKIPILVLITQLKVVRRGGISLNRVLGGVNIWPVSTLVKSVDVT